jgi:hypothetical protein
VTRDKLPFHTHLLERSIGRSSPDKKAFLSRVKDVITAAADRVGPQGRLPLGRSLLGSGAAAVPRGVEPLEGEPAFLPHPHTAVVHVAANDLYFVAEVRGHLRTTPPPRIEVRHRAAAEERH